MGGHGGLNILPQKSWNVYGRDNREKVARDEAKHAAELEEEKGRKLQDDREHRLKKLRDRARGSLEHEADYQQAAAVSSAAAQEEEDIATGRPQVHINFWGDDEANTASQDLKAEEAKVDEARRRGDPARQTSDARFDASFQLANGLQGAASKAWYVQPVGGSGGSAKEAHHALQQQQHYLGGVAVTSSSAGAALALEDGDAKKERRKEKSHKGDKERRHKKSHKREKERERDGSNNKRHRSSGGVAKKTIQELREARLQREVVERQRAAKAQIGRLI